MAMKRSDVQEGAAIFGAFEARSAEFLRQQLHHRRFALLGRYQNRSPI